MISKELLNEVLGYEASYIQIVGMKLCFSCHIKGGSNINIYELAHKCKEWAYKQGYAILSGHSAYGIGAFFCSCKGWLSENYDKRIEISHNTEPEAIFKACQWILNNKENK